MSPVGVPEITVSVNSQGITINCSALETPRFVPFEVKGRCSMCNSSNAEIEYVLHRHGLRLKSSRIKEPKFVAFDKVADISDKSLFRLITRNTRFNIPITVTPENTTEEQEVVNVEKKKKKNGESVAVE
jgi:hypothetical protein